MARKKNSETTTQTKKPSSAAISREKKEAVRRAGRRAKDEGKTMYIHQSTRWRDTFFVSPVDVHPNAKLIDQKDP